VRSLPFPSRCSAASAAARAESDEVESREKLAVSGERSEIDPGDAFATVSLPRGSRMLVGDPEVFSVPIIPIAELPG